MIFAMTNDPPVQNLPSMGVSTRSFANPMIQDEVNLDCTQLRHAMHTDTFSPQFSSNLFSIRTRTSMVLS